MPLFIRPLRATAALALLAAPVALGGCTTVGPESISSGRAAYSDVITRTNDEQLLNSLVRMRFGETTTMLMVTGVTAHTELMVGSGINVGIGQHRGYEGNLVPFSANGTYTESPTISYEPVSGEKYLKQLVTPISLDLYGLLVDTLGDTEWTLRLLTDSIGGLDNPVHYQSPRAEQLARVLSHMAHLRRAGVLSFAYRTGDDGSVTGVDLVMDNYADTNTPQVTELMGLLRKPMPQQAGAQVRLPLQMGRIVSSDDALRVETRSTLELMQLASHGVEVPQASLDSGVAPSMPAASAQPFLQVLTSATEPVDPFVVVKYRDAWYYVPSNDTASKRGFVAMQTLLQACLASGEGSGTPQLTLPVN